jgi:hypothetical protein
MTNKLSVGQRWTAYRPSKAVWFWSCVGCVVATLIVGFTWGGWVTGTTAAKMAQDAANSSQDQLAADFCAYRFEHSPDAAAQLAALKKTEFWDRNNFIRNGGWVTLPGVKIPVSDAAGACVDKLMNAGIPSASIPAKTAGAS